MSSEAKVGLLVIFATSVFVTTFLIVANIQLTGETITYRTYFAHIGGLDEGNVVRFGGRKAGTIQILRPWPDDMTKTEVVFSLRAEIPVNEESLATIASLNALGRNYLEIVPGSIDAVRIEPGGTVPSAEMLTFSDLTRQVSAVADAAVDVMGRIDTKFSMVADDIHGLMVNLQELTGEENQRNIATMLESSSELLETQTPKIDRITTQIEGVLGQMETLTDDFSQLARHADETVVNANRTIDETREPLKDSLAELEETLGETRLLLSDARALILLNEANIAEVVENFRSASEEIEMLSAELRQRPWILLRSRPKPDRQVPPTSGSDSSVR